MTDEPPHAQPLRRNDLDPDPLCQFHAWYEAARAAGAVQPSAVALATATPDGSPSVRFVLLKSADEDGFVFYSGYDSSKGRDLEANPRAALCFYWQPLGRQVRVEGPVARVPFEESNAYFGSRPYGAQLSAEELRARHAEGAVPRPEIWGGFAIEPVQYEFWQHRDDRLHDRFRYRPAGSGWTIERLSP
jgi:pyridoxamine 5'-phosphate oxidase